MNKKEEIQLKNAYRALNKIFKINEEMELEDDNRFNTDIYEYIDKIYRQRLRIQKYLHVIEAELDDVLGIFPRKIKPLPIFDKSKIS